VPTRQNPIKKNIKEVTAMCSSVRGEVVVAESKNENYPPIVLPAGNVQVLGRVVEAIRRQKW